MADGQEEGASRIGRRARQAGGTVAEATAACAPALWAAALPATGLASLQRAPRTCPVELPDGKGRGGEQGGGRGVPSAAASRGSPRPILAEQAGSGPPGCPPSAQRTQRMRKMREARPWVTSSSVQASPNRPASMSLTRWSCGGGWRAHARGGCWAGGRASACDAGLVLAGSRAQVPRSPPTCQPATQPPAHPPERPSCEGARRRRSRRGGSGRRSGQT